MPDIDGPTHAYIGASPGCWQIYGEVLAREYGAGVAAMNRMTVDAYCVQHPGLPERRQRQSVAVHLMRLCLMLERGVSNERAARIITTFTRKEYPWLEPPAAYEMTVLDVVGARDDAEHVARVDRWARITWQAWSAHHQLVRSWLDS